MSTVDKVRRRARRVLKHVRLRLAVATPAEHPLLHVVGCQRSGTTMLTELLDHDPRVRVFGELGELFDEHPRQHRLRDAEFVRLRLERSGAALNVVKPLVESHRCDTLLDLQPGAVAMWMFRHYRDVAASNLQRFGIDNGHANLRSIVVDDDDWRNAGLDSETRELVRSLDAKDLAPHDAAALFWYCRNTLWFNQNLGADDRIRTCRYEDLVSDPTLTLSAVYRWVGLPGAPPQRAIDAVHDHSVGKGRVEIGARVRALCDDMLDRLLVVDNDRSVIVSP